MLIFRKNYWLVLLLLAATTLSACVPFGPGGNRGGVHIFGPKGVFKSTDRGYHWQVQNSLAGEEQHNLDRYDNYQLAFDIFDSHILYRATSVGLFLSDNSAESWRQIFKQPVDSFALNPRTRGIIYAVSGNQLFKTTDNGKGWQLIYSDAKTDVVIRSVQVSHFDSSHVYLLTSEGVLLLSTDWGDSWKVVHDFKEPVQRLYLNPHNSQQLFVLTRHGILRSLDAGYHWREIIKDWRDDFPGIDRPQQIAFAKGGKVMYYLSKYGLLKSYNFGDKWQALKLITPPNSVDISTFTLNPTDSREIYYIVGRVLYHSLNGGIDWQTQVVPVPDKAKGNQILIDPQDDNLLYLSIGR